ncbi:MAG: hypothetical protein Fur0043_11010 [Anaerolineales bacterium]
MDENMETPVEAPAKKDNKALIIALVVLVVLCCCCVVAAVALYFGYDYLGDPLGIYGWLPMLV